MSKPTDLVQGTLDLLVLEDSCPGAASRLGPQPETETGFW